MSPVITFISMSLAFLVAWPPFLWAIFMFLKYKLLKRYWKLMKFPYISCEQIQNIGSWRVTQLLSIIEMWSVLLDGGDYVNVISLDFRKAFDTLPHWRLLKKLEANGIKDGILTWIENFLSGRKQWVVVNRATRQHTWADSIRHFYYPFIPIYFL
jgi:hypothetical protein